MLFNIYRMWYNKVINRKGEKLWEIKKSDRKMRS